MELFGAHCPSSVTVSLPIEATLLIPLKEHRRRNGVGECMVIKDAGDDPDVTHRAVIGARARLVSSEKRSAIIVKGGEGVGIVTKPGLPVPVGEPAINPVPRKMILQAAAEVLQALDLPERPTLAVEIFVPEGERLARKTLNPRLGILGGISILGTTGLVKPFSHEAYRATISASLRVAKAAGPTGIVLSTGGKSERYARGHRPETSEGAFVQMGDYVKFSVERAAKMGFPDITVACFFGKAVKIGQGYTHTHASRGRIDFNSLSAWVQNVIGDPILATAVAQANTARQVFQMLRGDRLTVLLDEVGRRMLEALRAHAGSRPNVTAMIFDFEGPLVWKGSTKGDFEG